MKSSQMHTAEETTATTKNGLVFPRRKFLTLAAVSGFGIAGGVLAIKNTALANMLTTPGRFAEELMKTPSMTEGPFYPDKLPLDTDNDLLILNDGITPAVGEVTHMSGRVLTPSGRPVRNAFVEIWQVDNEGVYLHSGSDNAENRDKNFQGYGRFLTNRKGEYYFRTIKPVPYPGRAPHIHVAVSINGKRTLTTQMLTRGLKENEFDGLFRRFKDQKSRDALTGEYKLIANSTFGELAVEFDLVLGTTPDENVPIIGGIAKPMRR